MPRLQRDNTDNDATAAAADNDDANDDGDVPIIGVDAYETDDEVRRPTDDEPDNHRHGHLDHVPLGRDGQLSGQADCTRQGQVGSRR